LRLRNEEVVAACQAAIGPGETVRTAMMTFVEGPGWGVAGPRRLAVAVTDHHAYLMRWATWKDRVTEVVAAYPLAGGIQASVEGDVLYLEGNSMSLKASGRREFDAQVRALLDALHRPRAGNL
jgi:hypothetical protein